VAPSLAKALDQSPIREGRPHLGVCPTARYRSRIAGYEDVNDAERLRHDPAMRWIVGGKAARGCAASPSRMGRLETQTIAALIRTARQLMGE
jgi:Transposase DDE domain group 1